MTRTAVLSALCLSLTGCFGLLGGGGGGGVDEDSYFEKLDKAQCKWAKSCVKYGFFYSYDDVSDCMSELEDLRDDADFDYDDCDFDEDAAAECIAAYNSTCKASADDEDYFEPCDEVWDCGGDVNGGDGGDDGDDGDDTGEENACGS